RVRCPAMTVLSIAWDRARKSSVLMDAQDWMSSAQLNDLWQTHSNACQPGARIVFRTTSKSFSASGPGG
ncbi:MAG: DUF3419 family protein, partial [Pseudomonadota bacterium]